MNRCGCAQQDRVPGPLDPRRPANIFSSARLGLGHTCQAVAVGPARRCISRRVIISGVGLSQRCRPLQMCSAAASPTRTVAPQGTGELLLLPDRILRVTVRDYLPLG